MTEPKLTKICQQVGASECIRLLYKYKKRMKRVLQYSTRLLFLGLRDLISQR